MGNLFYDEPRPAAGTGPDYHTKFRYGDVVRVRVGCKTVLQYASCKPYEGKTYRLGPDQTVDLYMRGEYTWHVGPGTGYGYFTDDDLELVMP